jgi:DNA-binding SARP family transcriptional activator
METINTAWGVSLVGQWALYAGGTEVVATRGVQPLVALLALQGPRDRAWLAGTLWPDCNDQSAYGNLRSTLFRIKQNHPGLVGTSGPMVSLAATVDADRVLTCGEAILNEGVTPADALTVLSAGELLPGWYEDWVLVHRERLRQTQLHALDHLAELLILQERYFEALQAALAAVRLEPTRESGYRAAARVHLAEGNAVEAIRQFEECRRLLAAEFGIPPSRQFLDLMRSAHHAPNPTGHVAR